MRLSAGVGHELANTGRNAFPIVRSPFVPPKRPGGVPVSASQEKQTNKQNPCNHSSSPIGLTALCAGP